MTFPRWKRLKVGQKKTQDWNHIQLCPLPSNITRGTDGEDGGDDGESLHGGDDGGGGDLGNGYRVFFPGWRERTNWRVSDWRRAKSARSFTKKTQWNMPAVFETDKVSPPPHVLYTPSVLALMKAIRGNFAHSFYKSCTIRGPDSIEKKLAWKITWVLARHSLN